MLLNQFGYFVRRLNPVLLAFDVPNKEQITVFQDIVFVIIGLAGLFFGGEWLVTGAARLARSFGLSTLVIGLTVVAFGTSAPELLVSLSAATSGNSDISIGNVVGSNIANIGLILGLTGLIFPIAVHISILRREIPILLIATAISAFLISDGVVSRIDGIIMTMGLIIFNVGLIFTTRRQRATGDLAEKEAEIEEDETDEPQMITAAQRLRELLRLLVGLGILLVGAQLTVTGSVSLARGFGISELVIGITLVAVGTSLPELATSVIAALRKQSDIAIGNIVGSNVFNLLGILGITAIVKPINVDARVITFDGLIMIGFTILLLPLVLNREIGRGEALMLLVLYFAFTIYTVAGM